MNKMTKLNNLNNLKDDVEEVDVKKYCYECGKEIIGEDYLEYDGEVYCEKCEEDYFTVCYDCGELRRIDEMEYHEVEDVYLCNDCSEHYAMCDECGRLINLDSDYNCHVVEDTGEIYCEECKEHLFYRCVECNRWYKPEDVYIDKYNNINVCHDCLNHHDYYICSQCGRIITPEDYSYYLDCETYCETCRDDYLTQCCDCGEWFKPEDLYTIDGEAYCEECREAKLELIKYDMHYGDELNYGGGEVCVVDDDLYNLMGLDFSQDTVYWFNCYFSEINTIGAEVDEYIESLPQDDQEGAIFIYYNAFVAKQYDHRDYDYDVISMRRALEEVKKYY